MAKGESRPCSTGESGFESARQLIFHRALYFLYRAPRCVPQFRRRNSAGLFGNSESSRAIVTRAQSGASIASEIRRDSRKISIDRLSRCLMYRNLADIEGVVYIGFFHRNLYALDILISRGVQSHGLHRFSDNRAKPINHSSGADRSVR